MDELLTWLTLLVQWLAIFLIGGFIADRIPQPKKEKRHES